MFYHDRQNVQRYFAEKGRITVRVEFKKNVCAVLSSDTNYLHVYFKVTSGNRDKLFLLVLLYTCNIK